MLLEIQFLDKYILTHLNLHRQLTGCLKNTALANIIRTPVASSRQSRPTHWLGYTNKTHLRGLKSQDVCISPRTIRTMPV